MITRITFTLALLCTVVTSSCTKSRPSTGGTDGATHFLVACDSSAECGPLSCVCGVCSKGCEDDAQCTGLDEGASCEAASAASCGSGGGQRACAVECDDRDDCSEYGARARCQDGRCTRPAPDVAADAGPAGAAGKGGSGGSGGTGGSSGRGSTSPIGGSPGSGQAVGSAGTWGGGACLKMDARSSGQECLRLEGYSWNGIGCDEVNCGCVGSDCDAIFETRTACEDAYGGCTSLTMCSGPSDCVLASRHCCLCMPHSGVDIVAVADAKQSEFVYRSCGAGGCPETCPDPLALVRTRYVPQCVGATASEVGQCTLLDLAALPCTPAQGCRVRARTCCECNADLSLDHLTAVPNGSDVISAALCEPGQACDDCAAIYPENISARCGASGFCELLQNGTVVAP